MKISAMNYFRNNPDARADLELAIDHFQEIVDGMREGLDNFDSNTIVEEDSNSMNEYACDPNADTSIENAFKFVSGDFDAAMDGLNRLFNMAARAEVEHHFARVNLGAVERRQLETVRALLHFDDACTLANARAIVSTAEGKGILKSKEAIKHARETIAKAEKAMT